MMKIEAVDLDFLEIAREELVVAEKSVDRLMWLKIIRGIEISENKIY